MNIAVIGFNGPNSVSTNYSRNLNILGHDIIQFDVKDICKNAMSPATGDLYTVYKKPLSLIRTLHKHEEIDIVLVKQTFIRFKNDLKKGSLISTDKYLPKDIPVLYHHTELNCTMMCDKPDILSMQLKNMGHYLRSMQGWEFHNVAHKFYNYPAVEPQMFDFAQGVEKDLEFTCIGDPDNTFAQHRDFLWNNMNKGQYKIRRYFKDHNVGSYFVDGVDTKKYLNLITRSKKLLLTSVMGVDIGRRWMEAGICKTIPVIWIKNDAQYEFNKEMGFVEDKTCYFFRDASELKLIAKDSYDEGMAERCRKMILGRHTYKHRAANLLKEVKAFV